MTDLLSAVRVWETTTDTASPYDLAGASVDQAALRTFVGAGLAGAAVEVIITEVHQTANEWQISRATITDAATDTYVINRVIASSNAGAQVAWSAGTRDVFLSDPFGYSDGPIHTIAVNTVLDETHWLVLCDSAVARTVTLPPVADYHGKVYLVKNINSGTITIAEDAGDTNSLEDGSGTLGSSFTLRQGDRIKLRSDGTAWRWLGDVSPGGRVSGVFIVGPGGTATGNDDAIVQLDSSNNDAEVCYVEYLRNSVRQGLVGVSHATSGLVTGSIEGDLVLRATNHHVLVSTDDGASALLKLYDMNDSPQEIVADFSGPERQGPADGDEGFIRLMLNTEVVGTFGEFVRLTWQANDVTGTSRDGEFRIALYANNTLANRFVADEIGVGLGGAEIIADPFGSGAHAVVCIDGRAWGGVLVFPGATGGFLGNRHSGNPGMGYYTESGAGGGHFFYVNGVGDELLALRNDGQVRFYNLHTFFQPGALASNDVADWIGNDARVTPSAGDEAYHRYLLEASDGVAAEFARMTWQANDVTVGAKDGELRYDVMINDVRTNRLTINEVGVSVDNELIRAHGAISVEGNAVATTIAASSSDWTNAVQVTVFDTDGVSSDTTPDHTNDHITITAAGDYKIEASISLSGNSGDVYSLAFFINNGATQVGSRGTRTVGAGVESLPLVATATLSLNDTIELWIQNETAGNDATIQDAFLAVTKI